MILGAPHDKHRFHLACLRVGGDHQEPNRPVVEFGDAATRLGDPKDPLRFVVFA